MDKEVQDGPKWLKDLEEKRMQRLKARLGHEAGAGSPCLTCQSKCPGLDLHFWRKICKNCKCGKESHDVNDDDIYGWAQFQLLGNKPTGCRKMKLPGRQEEVELEWAPRGPNDLVESYLKLLPTDLLPVKDSPAALVRKQTLQRQVPAHDIDPTLCHALTDLEAERLRDYVRHVRQNIVGVGHLAKLNQILQKHADQTSKRLQDLSLNELKPITSEETLKSSPYNLRDANYSFRQLDQSHPCNQANYTQELPKMKMVSKLMPRDLLGQELDYQTPHFPENNIRNIQGKLYENQIDNLQPVNQLVKETEQTPQKLALRDLAYSTHDPNRNYSPKSLNVSETHLIPTRVNVGAIHEIEYDVEENREPVGDLIPPTEHQEMILPPATTLPCHRCKKTLDELAIVITVERTDHLWHSECFKCAGCNQPLADMVYFYHKETDQVYCGRDYAKVKGIPRCAACDELIFLKEYCLAEHVAFHVKHFCCYACDSPLAGSNYVVEEQGQPFCLPCFESERAEKCHTCKRIISPDEQGANLQGVHFHATPNCFCCKCGVKRCATLKIVCSAQPVSVAHALSPLAISARAHLFLPCIQVPSYK